MADFCERSTACRGSFQKGSRGVCSNTATPTARGAGPSSTSARFRTGQKPLHGASTRITPWLADALLVNEYQPGQGITAHVDSPRFSGTVVSLSLGSSCVMEFTQRGSTEKHVLLLEPRSALVLSEAARTEWQHAIPKRKNDLWTGDKIPRSRRLSLTFRRVENGGS